MIHYLTNPQKHTMEIIESHAEDEITGRDLRNLLNKRYGYNYSAPAFYKMMAELEDEGLVKGYYKHKLVSGQQIKQRTYQLVPNA
jgi:repressor of nif and glnA expression